MKNRKFAWLLITIPLIMGCASTFILNQGQNRMVRYQQFAPSGEGISFEMILVEESHADFQDLYSTQQETANIKKVPPDQFALLVESLEDLGFVEQARVLPLNTVPRRGDASKAIVVENDAGQWIFLLSKDDSTIETREDFGHMTSIIRNCYDSIFSLQVIKNQEGDGLLKKERTKIEEENAKWSQ